MSSSPYTFLDKNGKYGSIFTICLFTPFHPFYFFTFFNPSNHSIPLFSTIFFNFPNPYTISLNLNHLYHLKIWKVKPFSKLFFKPFSKPFSNHLEWSKMVGIVSPNGGIVSQNFSTSYSTFLNLFYSSLFLLYDYIIM